MVENRPPSNENENQSTDFLVNNKQKNSTDFGNSFAHVPQEALTLMSVGAAAIKSNPLNHHGYHLASHLSPFFHTTHTSSFSNRQISGMTSIGTRPVPHNYYSHQPLNRSQQNFVPAFTCSNASSFSCPSFVSSQLTQLDSCSNQYNSVCNNYGRIITPDRSEFEEIIERQKKRKESHNAIERRRRDHINFTIKRLSTLVPGCNMSLGQDFENDDNGQTCNNPGFATRYCLRLNKGEILQAAAEYIEYLQKLNVDLTNELERTGNKPKIPEFFPSILTETQRQLHERMKKFDKDLKETDTESESSTEIQKP